MSRRSWTMVWSVIVLVVLLSSAASLPVPYVVETPGPTTDTLTGDLIKITGHATYPTSGALRLVTVSSYGGPGRKLSLMMALRGWISSKDAVVPEELLYPKGTTRQQARQEEAEAMSLSQQDATAAALRQAGIAITPVLLVQAVTKGLPAEGKLKAGDRIVSVDGKVVGSDENVLRSVIGSHQPGQTVRFVVHRGTTDRTVDVGTAADDSDPAHPHRTVIGINPVASFSFPFSVTIRLDDVGGPSAGLMFALGIFDKLTPGALTGGAKVAGTGTIDPSGKVGEIGGIPQKMAGARDDGATIFFSPAGNCAEAKPAVPHGLRLVKVTTLASAVAALDDVRAGKLADLPRC